MVQIRFNPFACVSSYDACLEQSNNQMFMRTEDNRVGALLTADTLQTVNAFSVPCIPARHDEDASNRTPSRNARDWQSNEALLCVGQPASSFKANDAAQCVFRTTDTLQTNEALPCALQATDNLEASVASLCLVPSADTRKANDASVCLLSTVDVLQTNEASLCVSQSADIVVSNEDFVCLLQTTDNLEVSEASLCVGPSANNKEANDAPVCLLSTADAPQANEALLCVLQSVSTFNANEAALCDLQTTNTLQSNEPGIYDLQTTKISQSNEAFVCLLSTDPSDPLVDLQAANRIDSFDASVCAVNTACVVIPTTDTLNSNEASLCVLESAGTGVSNEVSVCPLQTTDTNKAAKSLLSTNDALQASEVSLCGVCSARTFDVPLTASNPADECVLSTVLSTESFSDPTQEAFEASRATVCNLASTDTSLLCEPLFCVSRSIHAPQLASALEAHETNEISETFSPASAFRFGPGFDRFPNRFDFGSEGFLSGYGNQYAACAAAEFRICNSSHIDSDACSSSSLCFCDESSLAESCDLVRHDGDAGDNPHLDVFDTCAVAEFSPPVQHDVLSSGSMPSVSCDVYASCQVVDSSSFAGNSKPVRHDGGASGNENDHLQTTSRPSPCAVCAVSEPQATISSDINGEVGASSPFCLFDECSEECSEVGSCTPLSVLDTGFPGMLVQHAEVMCGPVSVELSDKRESLNLRVPICNFLTVFDLYQITLVCGDNFMSYQNILTIRRHLLLAPSLSAVTIATSLKLIFRHDMQASLYVCKTCGAGYSSQRTATLCECRFQQSEHYRRLLADAFNYTLVGKFVEVSPQWPLLGTKELKALSCASACHFCLMQPALRVRRLQGNAATSRVKVALRNNLEVIAVDNGAVYKCALCDTMYLTQVPCSVCSCTICGRCDKVLPDHWHLYDTPTKCTCFS